MKSAVGFSSDGTNLRAIAIGTKMSSQSSLGLNHERRRGAPPKGAWADGWPESDGVEGDVMKSIYHIYGFVLNPLRV
jgi:hypothetical protein